MRSRGDRTKLALTMSRSSQPALRQHTHRACVVFEDRGAVVSRQQVQAPAEISTTCGAVN
jgi:hypothetical protein